MENKRRNCKFDTLKNSEFCHYHSPTQDFILCPIDNSHSILKSKLENHVKICPKQKYENSLKDSIWFTAGINSKQEDEQIILKTEKNDKIKEKKMKILVIMQENERENLLDLMGKIEIAFEKALKLYNELTSDKVYNSQYFLPNLKNPNVSVSRKQKDEKQLDLILELMENFGIMNKDYIYLEYGAGKGNLSHQIAVRNNDKSAHILIEKEPRRNKFDKNHRDNQNFIRLRTDINDFNINILPQVLPEYKLDPLVYNVIGISKHMCGGATDLSLNSLFNLTEKNIILGGMCIVTCCHHRCDVETYCNIDFLLKLGFKIEEIPIFFKISSWGLTKIYDDNEEKEEHKCEENIMLSQNIKSEKKTEIGFKVKRIIDIGRCLFIKNKMSLNVFLMKYCDLDLTPENFAIIFKR